MYRGKKVLVTGGTGTIGPVLVKRLLEEGAEVTVVSIDHPERTKAVLGDCSFFRWGDLRDYQTCLDVAKGQDYVFHLMAIKGSSQIGLSTVASTYVPFLLCNTNMMEAAFRCGVKRYLFVGSINEYPALDIRHEDDLWKGPPQANDRYMGIAKRAGEAQAEAYLHEYGWDAVRIVRLSLVYGPYDDFDRRTAHVIPALIGRMVDGEDPVKVAGDGTAVRDFIYSEDVVEGMMIALEKAPPCTPINLGSGIDTTIKTAAETIADLVPKKPRIEWDPARPTDDHMRVLATQRAKELLGFEAKTPFREGIRKTIEWYLANKDWAIRRGEWYLTGKEWGDDRGKEPSSPARLEQPSLTELLDRLTIDQIKEVFDSENRESYAEEMRDIEHDLDLIFRESRLKLNAGLIRLIIALAQMNLHIWEIKKIMQTEPSRFQECMKLAHQLNGLRNQIKNQIMAETGLGEPSASKTNVLTDDLSGWALSILEPRESDQ